MTSRLRLEPPTSGALLLKVIFRSRISFSQVAYNTDGRFHGGHQLLHERRRTCVPGAVMGTIKSMAGNWVCVIPSTIMTPHRTAPRQLMGEVL